MYARLQTTPAIPTGPEADSMLDLLLDTIAGHPGFRGVYALQAVGTVTGHLLTLWDSAEEAADASKRTRTALGAPPVEIVHTYDRVLQVVDAWDGTAPGAPAAASLVFFDGPHSDAQMAAGRRAHEERLLPAALSVPGAGPGWVLVDPERRAVVVVALAASLEALEAANAAVCATEFLPGEDPALLSAPDRVTACRIGGLRAGIASSAHV